MPALLPVFVLQTIMINQRPINLNELNTQYVRIIVLLKLYIASDETLNAHQVAVQAVVSPTTLAKHLLSPSRNIHPKDFMLLVRWALSLGANTPNSIAPIFILVDIYREEQYKVTGKVMTRKKFAETVLHVNAKVWHNGQSHNMVPYSCWFNLLIWLAERST